MDFFSGLKKAYEKIETELNKSLNIEGGEHDEGDTVGGGTAESVDEEAPQTDSPERVGREEPTSGDGWGSWGDTDGGPVEGSARTSGVAARSMGKGPMGPGLAPQQHRSTSANSQPASASLPPSMPTRAAIGSPEQLAPPTSPPQKDTQPKTPPTSPPQKDTQPKTPPTSAPQESAMLQTSVAASPQHGTPSKGVAGKLEGLPREDLIKYVKKQAQMMQKLKAKNEELSKACEQLSSKGEERGSDHRGMQSEALAEELQIVKSQCDKLTTEHQQTKALCRQLQSERDDLTCELDSLKTKLACSLELLDQQKTENSEGLEELTSELQKARANNIELELQLESSTASSVECQQRLQDAELVIAELQEEAHQRELQHEKDLMCLTEELEAAQHLNQSLERQLFELRESRVVDEEAEQEQLRAEAKSLRKDLQELCHEKDELQREFEQHGSELASSREEVVAARQELDVARSSLLAKNNEAEQAQRVAEQQREVVAQLEGRCKDLSAQLQRVREEQLSVQEGDSATGEDTAEQMEKEVESLRALLSERCKELEEAVGKGDRTAEELAQAQEGIKAAEAQLTVVEGERQGLSEHVEELRLKVSTVEAELEETRKDLDREREDSRRKSREMTDMQQKADKWKTDASNIQLLQEKLTSAEEERDHLSTSLHEMNETLSGSEQKRLSEQQAHLELLKGAEGEAARLRGRIEELTTELSVSQDKCESVSAELESAQQQSRQLRGELEERVASMALMGDQSGKEVKQLRTELQTAEQQVRELSKKTEEQERHYQELRDTCARLESELATSQQQHSEHLAQAEQKEAKEKELRSQLSVCTQAQEASAKENIRSTKRIEELEEEVARLESNVTRVQHELEETRGKLLKTEKDVKASNLMDLELADYQHTVHSLEATVTDKEQELQEARLAKERQGTVVEELKKQLGESETLKAKSEEKMLKLKGLLKKTHNELTEAKKNEAELNQTISDLQSQLQEEQLRSEEAKVQVSELTVKMALSDQQHQSSVGTLQAALRHQEGRGRSLQEELGVVQETLKRRDEEFESYKVRAQSVLKQRSAGPAVVDAEAELRQGFEHQLSQLKEEVQTANDRLSSTLADLEELSEEHDQLARRHTQLLADFQGSESQWEKKYLELRTHCTAAEEEKDELVCQLRQEVQHVSQAYKDQITAMQKEHRGTVDGLREELHHLEAELQTAQHHHHHHQQQQQQKPGGASTSAEAVERSKGRHDEARLVLHGLGVVGGGSEPRSEGEGMEQPDHVQASQTVEPVTTPREPSVPRTPADSPLVSLERLLNGDTWAQESQLANTPVASLSDAQVRRQLLASTKKTEHLTEVLRESEANSMRLADQAKLLKEEIRRLERNKDREESVSNMEYLKNVILKFLHTTGQEQAQLVPVITSLLKLSQQERVFLEEVLKGNNPSVPDPAGSPQYQASKGKGLTSYIHRSCCY